MQGKQKPILVAGGAGMLGKLFFGNSDIKVFSKGEFDITRFNQMDKVVENFRPRVIINCAAFTNVAGAETQVEKAWQLNVEGVGNLIKLCNKHNVHLIHISSDYVFGDHSNKPLAPGFRRSPLNNYGLSKAEGEKLIENSAIDFTIIRSSWLFGINGEGFPKAIIEGIRSNGSVHVVNDQFGGPTPAFDLANFCISLARLSEHRDISGIFHFSGQPYVSWYEFAKFILSKSGEPGSVLPQKSESINDGVSRPRNSRLLCTGTENVFKIQMPDWREAF